MAVFTIYDGRTSFWQWDLGQRLVVSDDVCCEVHFCNGTTECALVCRVYSEGDRRVVDVPNVLLQNAEPLRVFAHVQSEGDEHTTYSEIFTVISRTKPDDYVYTETEVWTAEKAVEDALNAAKERGDFKGDKGDKGDPGAVKYVVVTELPETDTENAIYLLPNEDSPEGNLFDEYIFVDGKWEKIGSASVAVNLDEYVKNTDYATGDKAGVVKVSASNGISMLGNTLTLVTANANSIDRKSNAFLAITPNCLDYAVKAGMTNNTETLTDEEKAAACGWLGAIPKPATYPALSGCYAVNVDTGATQVIRYSPNAEQWSIAYRGNNGSLIVGTPTENGHATTKSYVDGRITANDDGTLTILLADGSKYKVNATKEET